MFNVVKSILKKLQIKPIYKIVYIILFNCFSWDEYIVESLYKNDCKIEQFWFVNNERMDSI